MEREQRNDALLFRHATFLLAFILLLFTNTSWTFTTLTVEEIQLESTSIHMPVQSNVQNEMKNRPFTSGDMPLHISSTIEYAIVHPTRVDHEGQFLSHDVHQFPQSRRHNNFKTRYKREANKQHEEDYLYFTINLNGNLLTLNVSENTLLTASHFLVERFHKNEKETKKKAKTTLHNRSTSQQGSNWPCQFRGHVKGHSYSSVALSTCDGLTGLIHLEGEDYFIEPLQKIPHHAEVTERQPHKIYKRSLSVQDKTSKNTKRNRKKVTNKDFCGVKDTKDQYRHDLQARKKWQGRQRLGLSSSTTSSTRHRRSLSLEHWVEMMVVVDESMSAYYNAFHEGEVERYVLTIINMVEELFHEVSIGNALHIKLVRLIILDGEENILNVTSHAENTLENFCRWAKSMNPSSDEHPHHHDVAVLLTRKDICSNSNTSCETLGLAHVAGMCQSHRSCNVNQDTGLTLAYTIAHELGHNFAMHHDGKLNECKGDANNPSLMAPHLTSNNQPLRWSSCSRQYITRFLDRNWGFCLMDAPSVDDDHLTLPSHLPGVLYDADHQCRLMFGPKSKHCKRIDDMCTRLWCKYKGSCRSKLHSAVAGTKCAAGKWCYSGSCVPVSKRPSPEDGSWSAWTRWSRCSRTCGVGISYSTRHCDKPTPKNGGRYCLGERTRYRTCNMWSCPTTNKTTSFRAQQCASFNNIPYKNKTYSWLPVDSPVYPCELHCYTGNNKQPFADRLRDKVVDGTKCFSEGRDICVDGICKRLGCDFKIDSFAEEDKCGVCRGNGLSCSEVNTTFNTLIGDEYALVGLIPKGARKINITEVKPSGNFLALRNPLEEDDFYLNGNYKIQWDFQFDLAGSTFNYKRINNTLDNISADGPITYDIAVMLLFVEENPGINITYIMPHNVTAVLNKRLPAFQWMRQPWTSCSRTCGQGIQMSLAICVERKAGVVEEDFCDVATRPVDKRRICSNPRCQPEWIVRQWQPCSVTCGVNIGHQKRSTLCIRSMNDDEQIVINRSECKKSSEPRKIRSCSAGSHKSCPTWKSGAWRNCSKGCGGGFRNRSVLCVAYVLDDVVAIDEDTKHIEEEYSDIPYIVENATFPDNDHTSRFPFRNEVIIKRLEETDFQKKPHFVIENEALCDSDDRPLSSKSCNERKCLKTLVRSFINFTLPTGDEAHGDLLLQVQQLHHPSNLTYFDKDFDVDDDLKISYNSIRENTSSAEYEDLLDLVDPLSASDDSNTDNMNTKETDNVQTNYDNREGSGITDEIDIKSTTTATSTLKPMWLAGLWGQCSTTCGIGARIRNVICSGGLGNCDHLKKPAPAERCQLKPCANWQYTGWTKCSQTCGEGYRRRKIQCIDSQSNELIRPHHCNTTRRPAKINGSCNLHHCVPWKISRWSLCNATCGSGIQRRRVVCSKQGMCDASRKPSERKRCLLKVCVVWNVSHWGRCPVNCGYGIKHREVKCIEKERRILSTNCNEKLKPAQVKKCNRGPCRITDYDFSACKGDRLKPRFCEVLREWGKCVQPSLAIQCCQTCKTFVSVRRKDKIS